MTERKADDLIVGCPDLEDQQLARAAQAVAEKARYLDDDRAEIKAARQDPKMGYIGTVAYSALRDAIFDMEFLARRLFWEHTTHRPTEDKPKAADVTKDTEDADRSRLARAADEAWIATMYLDVCIADLRGVRENAEGETPRREYAAMSAEYAKMAIDRIPEAYGELQEALVALDREARRVFWTGEE